MGLGTKTVRSGRLAGDLSRARRARRRRSDLIPTTLTKESASASVKYNLG